MRFDQTDMGDSFVTCDNIGSSKNILLAEFIHLKAHPPFLFDFAQAKSEKFQDWLWQQSDQQVDSDLGHKLTYCKQRRANIRAAKDAQFWGRRLPLIKVSVCGRRLRPRASIRKFSMAAKVKHRIQRDHSSRLAQLDAGELLPNFQTGPVSVASP